MEVSTLLIDLYENSQYSEVNASPTDLEFEFYGAFTKNSQLLLSGVLSGGG